MIVLTDSAVQAVRSAIDKAEADPAGLRIQVEAGGCAGYQYKMGLVASADPDDAVIENGGVSVFIDPVSQPLIAGTTIDFVVALEGSGFTFENPNAENRCSCGKSFG
jgi:iron-sulfur cluster assembly protein